MTKLILSDDHVRNLNCPEDVGHLEVFDSEIKGFYIDLLRSGRKSFRLRYRVKSKLHVITLGDAKYVDVAQARVLASEVLRKASLGVDAYAPPETLLGPSLEAFFVEQYLPYVKSYKRSWDTDESMIRTHLVPQLGHFHMSVLKPPDVAVFVEYMKAKQYALGTCNRALVLLRYGFVLAVRWGVISADANPMKHIKNLADDNKIEHFLTNDQAKELLFEIKKSENEMLQWIVLFLLYTGARKREVLEAKWSDFDLERRSWRIPKTKSGKVRHVPLSDHALGVLKAVKTKYGHHAFVYAFANEVTGLPYVSIFYSWDAARTRAGLSHLRIHDLRHSFASFLVNAGRSLYEVQEILGHADIRTTSRYAHLSRERLQEAVESVPMV
jgi:integrase